MTCGNEGDQKGELLLHFWLRRAVSEGEMQNSKMEGFLERECNFSLGLLMFGPSDFFGPRSKVVLRSEGYAWAPVSGRFNKLHEVGVLFYLFCHLFKCFVNA